MANQGARMPVPAQAPPQGIAPVIVQAPQIVGPAMPAVPAALAQIPNLLPSDFFPDKFDGKGGTSPASHIHSLTDYFQAQGIVGDQERLRRFRTSLKGKAREWYQNRNFAVYADLCRTFIEHFSGFHSRDSSAQKFRKLKYEHPEDMESYLSRLRVLADTLGYNNELIKDQFIQGLPDEVRNYVSILSPPNMEGCVDIAQRVLDSKGYSSSSSVSFAVDYNTPESSKIEGRLDDISEQLKQVCL